MSAEIHAVVAMLNLVAASICSIADRASTAAIFISLANTWLLIGLTFP